MPITWDVPPAIRRAADRVATHHPHQLVEQALARYAAGECRGQIAAELAIAPATLSSWVRRSGLPRNGRRPARLSNREISGVVAAVRAAGSIRAAARQLGRDERAVRLCLRRHAPDLLPANRCDAAARPLAGDPQLPVEPLAQLLDERVKQGVFITRLAGAAETTERRINAIRNREYKTVRLSTADRLCLACGESLAVIYPDDLPAAA